MTYLGSNKAELEEHWCHKCKALTSWVKGRVRDQCQGCHTLFPCEGSCGHVDCREARGEMKPDARGVLQPIEKLERLAREAKEKTK